MIGKRVLVTVNQSKHALYSHDMRDTKWRTDMKTVRQLFNLSSSKLSRSVGRLRVSSAAYKDTKKSRKKWKN